MSEAWHRRPPEARADHDPLFVPTVESTYQQFPDDESLASAEIAPPVEAHATPPIVAPIEARPFQVLFVCTGNIHRSVMGERLLVRRMRPGLPVIATSAGTQAAVDQEIGSFSAIALTDFGADATGHVPRQLRPDFALAADLILTAELEHRRIVLNDTPSVLRRIFSLREFARLASHVDPLDPAQPLDVKELRAQVLRISAQRGLVPRATSSEDIADPVRASLSETRERAREIAGCVDVVVVSLGLNYPS